MRQIRQGLFETNSSSVHTLTICSKDEYDEWVKGNLYFAKYSNKFATKDQVIEYIASSKYNSCTTEELNAMDDYELNKCISCYSEFETYYSYIDNYEWHSQEHTTKSGDEIVAFGCYGYI